jgi:hypothetical protein
MFTRIRATKAYLYAPVLATIATAALVLGLGACGSSPAKPAVCGAHGVCTHPAGVSG